MRPLVPLAVLTLISAVSVDAQSKEFAPPSGQAPSATPAPEPRTDPCDEDKPDDECWDLPRDRAEFSEATVSAYNEGPAVHFDRDNQDLAFYYQYPKSVAIDKQLTTYLHKDAEEGYQGNLETGRDDRAKALKLGISPRNYKKIVIETQWSVTAKSRRLIGLIRADGNVHIHEQIFETPYIWDRALGKMIPFKSLFIDPRAALHLITREYCADLKQQVIEQDPSALEETKARDFCPPISDYRAPVVIDSKGDRRIDAIMILVGHFRVYADGPYQGWAPITPKLLALIKPQYRSDFAIPQPPKRKR
jgi:hypothetical protein